MEKDIRDYLQRNQGSYVVTGDPWPAGAPGAQRKMFGRPGTGWGTLGIEVQSTVYYQYSFVATSLPATATYWILAEGDLDGDGNRSSLLRTGTLAAATWTLTEAVDDTKY